MTFAGLDLVAVSRGLSQLVERDGDLVDAFFERQESLEIPDSTSGAGVVVRREEGFAVRLARGREVWLSSGDGFDPGRFQSALRHVARAWPQAAYPPPAMDVADWPESPSAREVERFPARLTRALRERLVAFPMRVRVRRHRRWVQVVGPQFVPEPEAERYYSVEVRTPWGGHGRLAISLGDETVEEIADALCEAFRAREAGPPPPGESAVVLSPQAAAILLHEAVAHALEADTLAAGGTIEAAIGLRMGPASLDVLDDPASSPPEVRRRTDDEGREVERRWLLRGGRIEQPLADATWAELSVSLVPGAARRGDRNDLPTPRSSHLLLVPGDTGEEALFADGGIWVPEVARGALDVDSGRCRLRIPHAFRIRGDELGEPLGPFGIEGRVTDLMAAVEGVGDSARVTGAGWCAKGSRRVPVWATTPALRLGRVEITR